MNFADYVADYLGYAVPVLALAAAWLPKPCLRHRVWRRRWGQCAVCDFEAARREIRSVPAPELRRGQVIGFSGDGADWMILSIRASSIGSRGQVVIDLRRISEVSNG